MTAVKNYEVIILFFTSYQYYKVWKIFGFVQLKLRKVEK